jgi:hypothetical protein
MSPALMISIEEMEMEMAGSSSLRVLEVDYWSGARGRPTRSGVSV